MGTPTSQSPLLPSSPVTPQSRMLGPPTGTPGLAQRGSGPLSAMRGMTPQQAASEAQQAEREVEAQQRLLAGGSSGVRCLQRLRLCIGIRWSGAVTSEAAPADKWDLRLVLCATL